MSKDKSNSRPLWIFWQGLIIAFLFSYIISSLLTLHKESVQKDKIYKIDSSLYSSSNIEFAYDYQTTVKKNGDSLRVRRDASFGPNLFRKERFYDIQSSVIKIGNFSNKKNYEFLPEDLLSMKDISRPYQGDSKIVLGISSFVHGNRYLVLIDKENFIYIYGPGKTSNKILQSLKIDGIPVVDN